jgi:hypothetical protein
VADFTDLMVLFTSGCVFKGEAVKGVYFSPNYGIKADGTVFSELFKTNKNN